MDPPPHKRLKVTVACDACRARKAKCDGCEPVCGPCQRRPSKSGAVCTWSASSRLHTSNSHIRRLQDRIAELENVRPRDDAGPYDVVSDDQSRMPQELGGEPTRITNVNLEATIVEEHIFSQRPPRPQDSSPVYTVIGPTAREENSEGFFGSSSAGTFMQNVSSVVEQRLNGAASPRTPFLSPPGDPLNDRHMCSSLSCSHSAGFDRGDISLPLRKTADELMRVYWRFFHPTFPILDESATKDDFERLWTKNSEIRNEQSFYCLLNAIFAVSSLLNPDTKPQDRARQADQYYLRARNLLEIFQRGSLHTVQTLLLLSMYCQSSSNAHQCWIFMGLAIRIAQGLGLHFAQTSEHAVPQMRELLRRVWHGCILLDQIVASICGRPCGVGPRNTITVPLPLAVEGSETRVNMDYFNHAVKLCRILHGTIFALCSPHVSRVQSLDELYDHYFGHNPQDPGKPSVFDIEKDLKNWLESIPEYLKLEDPPRGPFDDDSEDPLALQHRLAVILQQNYLQVRLLLLRPFLSAVVTFQSGLNPSKNSEPAFSLPWNISLQCAVACVRVAQDAISITHSQRSTRAGGIGSTSPFWFNVLFVYTAAAVLIASLLSPSILESLSEESILASWRLALELLDDYTVYGPSITRLVTTLQVLFDMVPKRHSYQKRKVQQQSLRQRPTSTTSDTFTELPSGNQTVGWGSDSPTAMRSSQTGLDGWRMPEMEPHVSFSPLSFGFLGTDGDPFDLAWLTDLPPDLSF